MSGLGIAVLPSMIRYMVDAYIQFKKEYFSMIDKHSSSYLSQQRSTCILSYNVPKNGKGPADRSKFSIQSSQEIGPSSLTAGPIA